MLSDTIFSAWINDSLFLLFDIDSSTAAFAAANAVVSAFLWLARSYEPKTSFKTLKASVAAVAASLISLKDTPLNEL